MAESSAPALLGGPEGNGEFGVGLLSSPVSSGAPAAVAGFAAAVVGLAGVDFAPTGLGAGACALAEPIAATIETVTADTTANKRTSRINRSPEKKGICTNVLQTIPFPETFHLLLPS